MLQNQLITIFTTVYNGLWYYRIIEKIKGYTIICVCVIILKTAIMNTIENNLCSNVLSWLL